MQLKVIIRLTHSFNWAWAELGNTSIQTAGNVKEQQFCMIKIEIQTRIFVNLTVERFLSVGKTMTGQSCLLLLAVRCFL